MKRYTLIISIFVFAFVLALSAQIAPIVISEVFYDTPLEEDMRGSISNHHNGEFIELFNPATETVDISGWVLRDGDSQNAYKFPQNSKIPARSAILLVYRHAATPNFSIRQLFNEITQEQEASSVFYHSTIRLTNISDAVILFDNKNQQIDAVSWGAGRGRAYIDNSKPIWDFRAINRRNFSNLVSIQRKNIHATVTRIDYLQSDFEVARATPLQIPVAYRLPIVGFLYPPGRVDTNLPVGALAGSASVTPTGAATYQIPIQVLPGTNGFQPQVSIVYNSQGGHGALGIGWDIAGVSTISRGTQNFYHDGSVLDATTIQFNDTDQLYLDGQRLILLDGTHFQDSAVYGFETENFVRIRLKRTQINMGFIFGMPLSISTFSFTLTSPDGQTVEYGLAENSRVRNASHLDTRVLAWKMSKVTDVHGNEINYVYTDNGQYLSEINYNNGLNKLIFNYNINNRNPKKHHIADFVISQDKLLKSVEVQHNQQIIRSYDFDYTFSNSDSRLDAITEQIGDTKLNPTKIGWGQESSIQRVDLGKRADCRLSEADGASIYIGDINGDGYPDLIEFWIGNSSSQQGHFAVRFYDKDTKKFSNTGVVSQTFPFNCHCWGEFTNKLTIGDINNDGKDEIILMNRGVLEVYGYENEKLNTLTQTRVDAFYHENRDYQMFVTKIDNDEYNDIVIFHKQFYLTHHKLLFDPRFRVLFGNSTVKDLKNIHIDFKTIDPNDNAAIFGDFNGDGKLDILLTTNGHSNFVEDNDYFTAFECDFRKYHNRNTIPADFNGDGLTDFLFQNPDNSWTIKESSSYRFHARTINDLPIHPARTRKDVPDQRYRPYVIDYNGDGLPDIILGAESWKGSIFDYTTWYFYKNTGNGFVEETQYQFSEKKRMSKFQGVIADMNGDGIPDLVLSEGRDNTNYFYFTMPEANKRNVVHSITNGMGQTERFTYKYYSDYDQEPTAEPIRNLKAPVMVVDTHTNPAGQTTTYTFANGKLHKYKGFLGFLNVESHNNVTDIRNKSEFEIEKQFYTLLPQKQETYIGRTLVSSVLQTYETKVLNLVQKRHITRILSETVRDHVKGIYQHTGYVYDQNHNLSRTSVVLLDGREASTTTYSNYKRRDGEDTNFLPGTITTTNRRDGESISARVDYEYNTQGQITKKIEHAGTEAEVITEYAYYPTGNLESVKVIPYGITPRKITYMYDGFHYRFVTETINTLGQISYTDYDFATGNILSETGIDGLTTSYQYDNLGRLAKTILPNGEKITYTTSWSDEHGALYKRESSTSEVYNRTVSYYDRLGRVIRTTQTGANGEELVSRREYNHQGQVSRTFSPKAANEPERNTSYQYDNLGRITLRTVYDGNNSLITTYKYEKLRTTVTHPDGTETSSLEDFTGLVVERTDPGGKITYKYNAAGQPIEITSNGSTTRIEYDIFGRQIALHDPNAGTITYEYYADGQLKKQTNANGGITEFTYDLAGRTDVRTVKDYKNGVLLSTTTTAYSYVPNGNGIGQIAGITGRTINIRHGSDSSNPDNPVFINTEQFHSQTFTYNSNHLLASVTDRYEDTNYTFHYSYDRLWRPLQTISPSGMRIESSYDEYGNIDQVMMNGDTPIWQMESQNARGQIKAFKLGNNINAVHDYYDTGLLKTQHVSSNTEIQDMHYEYDTKTYSLVRRNNTINNRDERFEYDNLDRLTRGYLNGVLNLDMVYADNGNIMEKSGVGIYRYDKDDKPHAMRGIQDGTQGEGISGIVQEITYTPFNKVSSVQHREGNSDRYEIYYGLDQQRIKTSYYTDGVKRYDRYYFGTYEREVSPSGEITHIDFIYTPTGLTAINRRTEQFKRVELGEIGELDDLGKLQIQPAEAPIFDDGLPVLGGSIENIIRPPSIFSTGTLYFVFTDNLGSIQVITDNLGNVAAEYYYTAWGARILEPGGDNNITDRGYTGHEHLEPLGLINMNGRIYDPVLARFLSPDPYVQAPDFTQSFNRYSYCWNNPFKYTDPDGELLIAAIFMGAYINVAIQGITGNINSTSDFFKTAAVGALSGAAGAGAGGAVSGAFGAATSPWAAIGQGALTGAAGGAAGGFVGGAGNAWAGGANFGDGLKQGLIGAGTGTITGGVIGGIQGGIRFQRQSILFDRIAAEMGIDPRAPLPRSDEVLNMVTDRGFKSRGYNHYFQFVDNYSTDHIPADIVKKMAAENARGATIAGRIGNRFTGRSSVYFSERAFESARSLFFTIGHELVHVGQNAYLASVGFSIDGYPKWLEEAKEIGAHNWVKSLEAKIDQTTPFRGNHTLVGTRPDIHGDVVKYLMDYKNFSIHLPPLNPHFHASWFVVQPNFNIR